MSTQPQMQAAMSQDDKARERLLEHRTTMMQMWGADFESDPRYAQALTEVRKGRYPAFVLDDFRFS